MDEQIRNREAAIGQVNVAKTGVIVNGPVVPAMHRDFGRIQVSPWFGSEYSWPHELINLCGMYNRHKGQVILWKISFWPRRKRKYLLEYIIMPANHPDPRKFEWRYEAKTFDEAEKRMRRWRDRRHVDA